MQVLALAVAHPAFGRRGIRHISFRLKGWNNNQIQAIVNDESRSFEGFLTEKTAIFSGITGIATAAF
jgi:hypothetical protein